MMRIVLDFDNDISGRMISLAEILSGCGKDVQIMAAAPVDAVSPVKGLRRCIERWIPRRNIRVWESPGPEPVTHLLHRACVAGLAPDVVVTPRPAHLTGLPCVDVGTILKDRGLDQILEMLSSRAFTDSFAVHPGGVRMTLAMVSPLPPLHTGIADYTRALLPALTRYYDVDVVVDQDGVSDEWVLSHCGIRTPEWFLKNGNRYDRILYHIGNSAFHYYMLDLMETHPGVVCLHDFFLGHFLRYAEFRTPHLRAWARALFHDQGYKAVQEYFQTLEPESLCLTNPCSFSLVKNALGVMVHSRYSKKLACDWYPGMDERCWKQIPMVRQPPDQKVSDVHGEYGSHFYVCAFGMLGPTKLNHRLVSAWLGSDLAGDPNCFLVFVGEKQQGNYCRDLEKNIARSGAGDRIRIIGRASPEDYAAWLTKAAIAVQLRAHSRGETSAAVLDCMNYGLPVIVNDHGANSELRRDAVWMLPDDFNDSELIHALETLKQNTGLRERLGRRSAQTIADGHNPDTCARACVQAVETFYRRARNRPSHLVHELAALECVSESSGRLEDLARALAMNQPDPVSRKRVFIDVSATIRRDLKAGIDRVSRSLVLALIQAPPQGYRAEPVFLVEENGGWHYRAAGKYTSGLLGCPQIWTGDSLVEFQAGDMLFCPDLTGDILVAAEKTGLFDRLRQTGVTLVFTVFDLLPLQIPDKFPAGADRNFHYWLTAVCRIAHKAVCISRSVAQELSGWFETDPRFACVPMPAIDWFHLGADLESSFPTTGLPEDADRILDRINNRLSFLMVGTLEPRKGHLQTLGAFEQLWAAGEEVNLVIVGKQGWTHLPDESRRIIPRIVNTLATHPEKGSRLFWLEGISDQFLEKIYDVSNCLVAASEAEGFGLPLIEAAQHGLPVLARDIPVFREVAGKHAYYFQGGSPEDLAEALFCWMAEYQGNRHPKSDTMPWLTWKQSTQRLVRCLKDAAGDQVF